MWPNGEALVAIGVAPDETFVARAVGVTRGEAIVATGVAVGVAARQAPLTTMVMNKTIRTIGFLVKLLPTVKTRLRYANCTGWALRDR